MDKSTALRRKQYAKSASSISAWPYMARYSSLSPAGVFYPSSAVIRTAGAIDYAKPNHVAI
jgi:hypothetical protein